MLKSTFKLPHVLGIALLADITSCSKTEEAAPLRTKIDYATLTATTPYSAPFVDATGKTTVDLSNGNNRYKMFQTLNTYISSSISSNKTMDATVMKNMFANTGNQFADSTKLNTSGVQLRNTVASSWPTAEAEMVRVNFSALAEASKSLTATASNGKAGKAGTYLVDGKGIELIQLFQKSMIGALQYDYIANVLLTKGLDADNSTLVPGKAYSQLEQNWDEAYGMLTLMYF